MAAAMLSSFMSVATLRVWGVLLCHYLFCFSPAYATPKLLDRLGMQLSDIDVFEYHEAFAVSVCVCVCVAGTFSYVWLNNSCIKINIVLREEENHLYVNDQFS